MSQRIEIYDTTLRDGTQGEGFSLSLQDKLLVAQKLDDLGVDYIEGGFPLSNPKDAAFFRDVFSAQPDLAKSSTSAIAAVSHPSCQNTDRKTSTIPNLLVMFVLARERTAGDSSVFRLY